MRRISCASKQRSIRATARCTVFSSEILDERPGLVALEITGKNAKRLFQQEPGGHRFQRVPPSEKHGRRHTSTVTVAVLPIEQQIKAQIADDEIEWQAVRGSGKGGQARNKTSNAVVLKHIPSGIIVRVETSRSQWQNRESAKNLLLARLAATATQASSARRSHDRKNQIGSGQRGDKIRTIRMQDGSVVDHRTGKRMTVDRYLRGHISDLI